MVTKPQPPIRTEESAKDLKTRHLRFLMEVFAETGSQRVLEEALRLQKEVAIDSLTELINAQADAYNAAHPSGPRMPKL